MANGNGRWNFGVAELVIGVLLVIIASLTTALVEGARGETKFVLRCEYESLCKRIDRIESKIDRILERENR